MKYKFKLGDKVETLDDVVRGEVIGIEGDLLTIRASDGFTMQFAADEMMKIEATSVMEGTIPEEHWKTEKFVEKKKGQNTSIKKNAGNLALVEVDLHIEKLISRPGQMSVDEILIYQIDTAKRQLEDAINKRISNVVFIHGVGAGVLKSELHSLFRKDPRLSYRDAKFRHYGMGATEVLITY
ncbi:MAG: Smr/MutS family protein [Flavobacteriaceae bacterium]